MNLTGEVRLALNQCFSSWRVQWMNNHFWLGWSIILMCRSSNSFFWPFLSCLHVSLRAAHRLLLREARNRDSEWQIKKKCEFCIFMSNISIHRCHHWWFLSVVQLWVGRSTVTREANFASNKFFSIHWYLIIFSLNRREDIIHKKSSLAEVLRAVKF